MIDISLNGAFLSSTFMPQIGDSVTLKLKLPPHKDSLELPGKVVRGAWAMSDHGKLGRFGLRFSHTPLDIVRFINKPK